MFNSDPSGRFYNYYKDIFNVNSTGFSIRVRRSFLDKNRCLRWCRGLVRDCGKNGKFKGMTAERIAKEIYAHVVIYYKGERIKKNKIYKIKIVKKAVDSLMNHANPVDVNKGDYRYPAFAIIWGAM